jgi:hypothetical protein
LESNACPPPVFSSMERFQKVIDTEGPVVARPGWVPEEASSAQPLWSLAAWASMGSQGSKSFRVLMPLPQCGPYEVLEGIYSGRQEKIGGGQGIKCDWPPWILLKFSCIRSIILSSGSDGYDDIQEIEGLFRKESGPV